MPKTPSRSLIAKYQQTLFSGEGGKIHIGIKRQVLFGDLTRRGSILNGGRLDLGGGGYDSCGCGWFRREGGRRRGGIGCHGLGQHHGSQFGRARTDHVHRGGGGFGCAGREQDKEGEPA